MLKGYLAIMRRELFYMWRDRAMRNILLFGTILALLLFSAVYSTQVLKELPTGVVDYDNSSASRELVEKLENAEYLHVTAHYHSFAELEENIKNGHLIVGVAIPENYGQKVALNRYVNVAVIIDGTNIIFATNASSSVMRTIGTISANIGIKTMLAKGVNIHQAQQAFLGVTFHEDPWFNPTLNYAYFLVLALALNIWQQCCTLAACMNVIGETGMKSWYQIKSSGLSKFKLFFSKSLVQIAVFMLIILPVYYIAFAIIKLPLNCSYPILLLFTLAFAIAIHSIGTLASSFARNAVDASRFGMIIALPSFILSGYTWPLESMPWFIQKLAWALPQTWFFQGLNYLTFKGNGWPFMSHYFFSLGLIAAICYSTAALFVRYKS